MIGTLINVATVLIGGGLGLLFGARLSDKLRQAVIAGLGLFTFAFGIKMFIETQNALIVLGSLLIGVVLGEWWQIERALQNLGSWLEQRFNRSSAPLSQNRFVRGFLTASLLFCVGPMAILGSIQDGLTGNFETLLVKSILDGFAALAFASSLGAGVLFSALVVFVYQGALTLLAVQVQHVVSEAMMTELSATGGVILLAIAVSNLLEIRPIRSSNFLPALIIAPLLVAIMSALGLY